MAFSSQDSGFRRGRAGARGSLSEINVVPLVDVVLVLLIIFMLTAHVMEFGLEIEVPKVRQVRETTEDLPVVSIGRDGSLYLNEQAVNINQLPVKVGERFKNARSVYVRADKATPWDPIAQVISALGEAKLDVRVVTQPEETERPRAR